MTDDTAAKLESVPFRITHPELIDARRYHDEGFFKAENQNLWPHAWQMACRLEEVPEPGDYTVYNILDRSVLMIHTSAGVKGFINTCRHRGLRLASGPGHCGPNGIVCPFHGWRWNADGENTFVFGRQIFTPDIIEKAQIDLVPVRTEHWAGCAFINFDDRAPGLVESLGPVVDKLNNRQVDKLRAEWWYGTVIPCNWKIAMEAFHESYHVMQTHRQLWDETPNSSLHYGPDFDGTACNVGQTGSDLTNQLIKFHGTISDGMGGGIYHQSEVAILERFRDMDVPQDPAQASGAFYKAATDAIVADTERMGAASFDLLTAMHDQNYVEFIFPNFFLLPGFRSFASYRIRPITAETCLMEIWCLVPREEGCTAQSPTEPIMLPYDSQDFPLIPKQDYSNLPLQQLGLHGLDFMRIGKGTGGDMDGEGLISNYQRVLDGFLARLDHETLKKAQNVANSGFQVGILDIGY
ncbi:MAG: aromatic ring-hydroxylating dioxygenase subunit alpha [Sphingomonadales bacterium]|nr:aromatic ring-hydroxylating dioxygenase subunit alpha [Sphingomonadales bacterium]